MQPRPVTPDRARFRLPKPSGPWRWPAGCAGRFAECCHLATESALMEPWYKVATRRKEVREGRSFNPDEFAIALERAVAGTAPEDYRDPAQFFARTCFTRALREHA